MSVEASGSVSKSTSHHVVVAIMKIERYYSSVKEEVSPLADDAFTLLERKDYIGFFKACGPNYIRSIRRAQEVSAIFKFSTTSSSVSAAFSASLQISTPTYGGGGEMSASSKFDSANSSLTISIQGFGMGLSQEGSETMVATSIAEYKDVMLFSFRSMTTAEDAHAIGMVYGMEVVPWVNNVAFQAAAKLGDENIVLNQPRSLIERATTIIPDVAPAVTAFANDATTRALFRCKADDDFTSIDQYGYCCESNVLFDSALAVYHHESDTACRDASTCVCKPVYTLDKALIKDNMANNGEFVARLDNAMRYKLASIATLEKCISAIRNIPEKFDYKILESTNAVMYDKDTTLEISVIEMKAALDPMSDYGVLTHMTRELDEWIAMYYSPCLAELYGMNVGSTPTTDVSYFMAYPWYKHDTCMKLSCLVNQMRWDRVTGAGCIPSVITGWDSPDYGADETAEPYCAKKWDEATSTENCKIPTDDLVVFQTGVKACWNATLLNSNVDYLINNFCLPTITDETLDQTRIDALVIASASC